ncbi:MAG: nucleoside hydrolase, partial [Ilumatobacteraceae bacterium]
MSESTPAVILDCDPGHDDVVAIVAAARHTELLGITTVAGNVPLSLTTRNAL